MINLTGTLPDGHTPDLTITRDQPLLVDLQDTSGRPPAACSFASFTYSSRPECTNDANRI